MGSPPILFPESSLFTTKHQPCVCTHPFFLVCILYVSGHIPVPVQLVTGIRDGYIIKGGVGRNVLITPKKKNCGMRLVRRLVRRLLTSSASKCT